MKNRLDSPTRLRLLTPGVVDTQVSPMLDAVVREASRVMQAPIAVVTLMLRTVQYFRASVGLPKALEISRATSRCDSFCQLVVERDAPLIVSDARREATIPQALVRAYGIRAYVGVPIHLGAEAVGSLCVMDVVPRRFDATASERMKPLARDVTSELQRLSAGELYANDESCAAEQLAFEASALIRLHDAVGSSELSVAEATSAAAVLTELEASLAASLATCHPDVRVLIQDHLETTSLSARGWILAQLLAMTGFAGSLDTPEVESLRTRVTSAISTLKRSSTL